MTSRDFCYWLQGFFEISKTSELQSEQVDMIQRHLNLVFKHEIDPSMGGREHQKELDQIHNPTLQELGEQHGFQVTDTPCPGPGYEYSTLHKIWYDPLEGAPRC